MLIPVSFHLWLLQLRRRRQRRIAPYDRSSFLQDRRRAFQTFYRHLRRRPRRFHSLLEMGEEVFDLLLSKIRNHLEQVDAYRRQRVSPEEMLILTLRHLTKGQSFSSLHLQFLLTNSTISGIVKATCRILWDVLQPEELPHPTAADWLRIAAKFQRNAQFPNCVGALDAKHFRCLEPLQCESSYHDYTHYCSVIMMAIVDTRYRFIAVDFATFDEGHDSQLFKTSNMGKRLYNGEFGFPPPRPLPGTQEQELPFVLAGSEAFQMSPNLLKPYDGSNLDDAKRKFNHRLWKARYYAEGAFFLLTERWKVLTKCTYPWPEDVEPIVKACVVLQNFFLSNSIFSTDPGYMESELPSVYDPAPRSSTAVMMIRDQFADYLSSPEGRRVR